MGLYDHMVYYTLNNGEDGSEAANLSNHSGQHGRSFHFAIFLKNDALIVHFSMFLFHHDIDPDPIPGQGRNLTVRLKSRTSIHLHDPFMAFQEMRLKRHFKTSATKYVPPTNSLFWCRWFACGAKCCICPNSKHRSPFNCAKSFSGGFARCGWFHEIIIFREKGENMAVLCP